MTRQEFISKLALLDDDEFNKLINIYKNGGIPKLAQAYIANMPEEQQKDESQKIEQYLKGGKKEADAVTQESKPIPEKPKTFEEFFKMLPDNEAQEFREGKYNWVRAFELAPWEDIVNHLIDPNAHHMRDFYWNLKGEGEFMKNKNYPNLYDYSEDSNQPQGEIGWYLHSPEAEQFRREYELDDSGIYPKYKKRPTKHEEGGTIDLNTSNLNEQATSTRTFIEKNITLQGVAEELNKKKEPEYKQIKLCKNGSILDQLKEQLPDPEIIDLLQHFGIEELMDGGIKNTGKTSISITIMSDMSEDQGHKVPDLKDIEIGDKQYRVEIVSSEEDMEKGLGERESLDKDKGMLFDFKEEQEEVTFNTEEMKFNIDIIFINKDEEVTKICSNCKPGSELFEAKNVRYVLEVNANSGIEVGDELDLNPEDADPIMKVLAPDGSTQMELLGGERIFSRKSTKRFIKWAKRAEDSQLDSDFKHLGQIMFKEIKAQDSRPAEYVEVPEN